MPTLTFHLFFAICAAILWPGHALSNPVEAWPSSEYQPLSTTLSATADTAPRAAMGGIEGHLGTRQPESRQPQISASANDDQLIESVRLLDAGDQGFQAVAVNLPVNLVFGETEVNLGVGWIGPQNQKPAGDITQGSAPQFAEKRFRDSAENSLVFLFRIPF